jgi:transglutaminase-like putative cysteine protease
LQRPIQSQWSSWYGEDYNYFVNRDLYSAAAEFIDSSDPDVHAFARQETAGAANAISRAVKLYYAVRDGIFYDPYYVGEARAYFRASDCLRAMRGFCIPKAALLAATARSVGIPARDPSLNAKPMAEMRFIL